MRRVALCLLLSVGCAHATRVAREAKPGEPTLDVLTYNLNYGIAGDPDTVEAILERDVDVVFLQETNTRWRAALEPKLKARYPGQLWVDGGGAWGLAVLSKRPLVAKRLDNPSGWFPAIRFTTQTPLGTVQGLCVHLHPPVSEDGSHVKGYFTTDDERLDELRHFLGALDPRLPTIVAGDFNESMHGDALHHLEARGLRTTLPEFHPRAKTWHWPLVGKLELTAQLDHVAYSDAFEPIDAHVESVGNSDHWPVTVTFVRTRKPLPPPPMPYGGSLTLTARPRPSP